MDEKDLSHYYSKPLYQKQTAACLGFAVASDIEFELYKKSLGGFTMNAPDAYSVYNAMLGRNENKTCDEKSKKEISTENYHDLVSPVEGNNWLEKKPLCLPKSDMQIKVTKVLSLKKLADADFDFFKKLVEMETPPTISVDTESADYTEEWTQLTSGGVQHAFAVVGFGSRVNPKTLKNEPYLLVRDSLNTDSCHSKIAFSDLKKHLTGVWKISNFNLIDSE